jgi:hypothetical protein
MAEYGFMRSLNDFYVSCELNAYTEKTRSTPLSDGDEGDQAVA